MKTLTKTLLGLLLTTASLFGDCDASLEDPHTMNCGGFTLSLGDFRSPCCSYSDPKFDIFDAFRDGDEDKNISTKILNNGFDINITSQEDFNGTLCVAIKSDEQESDWIKVDFNTTKIITIEDDFVSFLTKEANIFLKYKENDDAECSEELDGNETSEDAFAIRPKEFFIKLSDDSFRAGEDFNISFIAGADVESPAQDYNETNEGDEASFYVAIQELKDGCILGEFTPDITKDLDFGDGTKDIEEINYNEVSEINLTIAEDSNCSKRYAKIDCDDKESSDWELSITPKSKFIHVLPYDFSIKVLPSNFNNNNFTYIANEKEKMSALLDINITARNKDGERTQNYNNSCYAKDLDIKLHYEDIEEENLGDFLYYHQNDTLKTDDKNVTKNEDVDFVLEKGYFQESDTNGSALFKLFYNFARDYSKPVSPFDINISSIQASDANDTKGEYTNETYDANFCFARILSKDIKTAEDGDISKTIFIEIFDNKKSSYSSDFSQTSLYWYKHQNHSHNNEGNITAIDATFNSILKDTQFSIDEINSPQNGEIKILIPKHEGRYTLHLKTDKWLWYGLENFSDAYDDTDESSCSSHPCFHYTFNKNSSVYIHSGTYTGADINIKSRGDSTKSGIKVFR